MKINIIQQNMINLPIIFSHNIDNCACAVGQLRRDFDLILLRMQIHSKLTVRRKLARANYLHKRFSLIVCSRD